MSQTLPVTSATRRAVLRPFPEPFTVQILLPAYNEASALPTMLESLESMFRQARLSYHVTVVDDGSQDDTARIARKAERNLPLTLIQHPVNQGLAAAMRTGLRSLAAASSLDDIIVTMDCDNTHPIGLIPRMLQEIHEGRDVVVASRFQSQSRVMGVPAFRQLTGIGAAVLFKLLFPIKGVRDYTCGFRAYRADAVRRAFDEYGDDFISEQGFTCMVDILLKLSRLQMICSEVPMVLRYDQKVGQSKMPVGKTVRQSLRLAFRRRVGILD